jgi:ribosomal protein S18 acetylase RimI-like enzyme
LTATGETFDFSLPQLERKDHLMPIRRAQPDDTTVITQIRITCWKATYGGIIPDDFLTPAFIGSFVEQRHQSLPESEESSFVAVDEDQQIMGYTIGGPTLNPHLPFEGEVYEIYLLPHMQKRGLGQALMRCIVCELVARGYRSMMLHVLADNRQARRFYEQSQGQLIEHRSLDINGTIVHDVGYGWTDIKKIPGLDCEQQ